MSDRPSVATQGQLARIIMAGAHATRAHEGTVASTEPPARSDLDAQAGTRGARRRLERVDSVVLRADDDRHVAVREVEEAA